MSAYRDEPLVMAAVRMALAHRVLVGDLIHHTDRSNQYTADDYLALLKAHGVTVSMSGKGDPYNNVMMESFFSTLRAECTERHHFTSGSQTYSGCHTVCSLPGLTVVMRKPSHDEAKGKTV
jgi:transposase InsO family protein